MRVAVKTGENRDKIVKNRVAKFLGSERIKTSSPIFKAGMLKKYTDF